MTGSISYSVLLTDPSLGRFRTLYALSLSTGAVHPSAHPSLIGRSGSFKAWKDNLERDDYATFMPCTCGDYVACNTRIEYITIWNWKTGALVSDQVVHQITSCDFGNIPRQAHCAHPFIIFEDCGPLLIVRFS